MEVNLIELLGKQFGGGVVSDLSGMLGEPENGVQKAVGGLGPVLVGALANKASSSQGLTDLFGMFKSGGFDGSQSLNLGSLAGDKGGLSEAVSAGAPQVVSLLGDSRGGVTEWLASFAGIGPKSAASLLSLAAPVLLNLTGAQAEKSGGFNQAALGQLLGGQGEFLRAQVPADLASALGITDLSKLGAHSSLVMPEAKEAAQKLKRAPAPAEQKLKVPAAPAPQKLKGAPAASAPQGGSGSKWWLWVIIILVVIAIVAWWILTRAPA